MITYRFDPDYTVEGRHYAHPLIAWDSVIAGALLATGLVAALSLVGVAVGASWFNPFAFERQEDTLSVGGGLYMMFAHFVAFQLGGYVAAHGARWPDHHGGALNGVLTWALAAVFGLTIAALGAAQLGGSEALTAQAVDITADVRNAADTADLSAAEAGADALATVAWWAAGALLMGAAGSIAGGWLGAHHPAWEKRPRIVASDGR